MIQLYGIKSCGSVRKAITLLESHKIPYHFIDLKQSAPSIQNLREWMARKGAHIVCNTKGTTYKNLKAQGVITEALSLALQASARDSKDSKDSKECAPSFDKNLAEELLALLHAHPLLLKRPIITQDEALIIGFEEDLISALGGGV